MPSFVLILKTVWPQCRNVTDRTDRQTDRQDNGPIAYGEPFYKRSPKNRHRHSSTKKSRHGNQWQIESFKSDWHLDMIALHWLFCVLQQKSPVMMSRSASTATVGSNAVNATTQPNLCNFVFKRFVIVCKNCNAFSSKRPPKR